MVLASGKAEIAPLAGAVPCPGPRQRHRGTTAKRQSNGRAPARWSAMPTAGMGKFPAPLRHDPKWVMLDWGVSKKSGPPRAPIIPRTRYVGFRWTHLGRAEYLTPSSKGGIS
jgi:hypothetical protein